LSLAKFFYLYDLTTPYLLNALNILLLHDICIY